MKSFDYEDKIWGASEIKLSPFYIQALKLKYVLEDLSGVHGKVLEIGCGAGSMLRAIQKYRPDLALTGIDISKNAIKYAQKNSKKIMFETGNINHLPFKEESFDAIIMFDVLEHLDNPGKALRETGRVLKQNGTLHVFSPLDNQPGTLHSLLYKFGWRAKDNHTGHVQWYSNKSFRNLLMKNNFRVIKTNYSFHMFLSFFDAAYYTISDLLKLKIKSNLQDTAIMNKSIIGGIFKKFYQGVIALSYYESMLLKTFPIATGGHYLIYKK